MAKLEGSQNRAKETPVNNSPLEKLRDALSKIDRNMLQTMALRADKAGRPRIEEAPLAAKTTRRTAGPVGCSQQIDSSLGTERRVAPAVGVTGFARTTS